MAYKIFDHKFSTRVSLVTLTGLVLTRVTLSWICRCSNATKKYAKKQDFSHYLKFPDLVMIVGYINKHLSKHIIVIKDSPKSVFIRLKI